MKRQAANMEKIFIITYLIKDLYIEYIKYSQNSVEGKHLDLKMSKKLKEVLDKQ